MARFTSLLILFTGTTVIFGCADQKPIAPALVEQPETPDQQSEPADLPSPEPPAATNTDRSEVAVGSPHEPQRILLLARGGPLLVDVWLTIDGRPHEEGLAALIERVMSAGDLDGDGHPTWSEWSGNQEFLQGELVNDNPVQKRRIHNWVKRYDENEDNQIQWAEAASWLGRDGGRSAAALTLRSSRAYFAGAASSSRLWHLLDDDDNGQLSGDEIAAVSKRLFLLDTNDDRIVDLSELASLRAQLTAQSPQRSSLARRSTRHAAIRLTDRSEAGSIDYLLGDLYAPRQQLGPHSFPARSRLFGELDNDDDRSLDNQELESLLEIEPHVKVSLNFTSDAETGKAVTRLILLEHAQEIEQVLQPSANRFTLVTSDTRLNFSAHDTSNSQRNDQVVQRNQIGLMIHDRGDGLFEALDSDGNGKLGEREITEAADRIQEFDANEDRLLAADELLYSMTVAFLRSEPPGEQSFYVPSFTASSVLEAQTPAWFGHADLNSDGDVSKREFLGSLTQFLTLDSNRDGFISGAEATLTDTPQ